MTNQTESEKPLSVQWLNAAGQGGGRHNNQTVTVSGVLPGETIHWTPLKGSGRTIRGRLVDIVEPSAWRAVPRCPYQASCGGCDMAHLAPPGRGHFFPAIAARTLGFAGEVLWIASPRQTGHRARIKLSIIDGQLGYLKENTHSLVPITQCEIARPEVQDVLKRLSAPRTYGTAKSIEIRSDGNRVALDIISPKGSAPGTFDLFSEFEHVSLNGRVLFGDPVLTLTSQGLPLRASPAVFYQVNLEVNALLVNYVCDQVRQLNPTRVLDLFSGLGNFGLPLAQSGIDVIAVEQPGRAIEDCRYSVAAASLGSRVQIMAMNVKRFDPTRSFFDVAIVDPPRAGTLGGLSKLLLNRPTDIFYVSCHLGAAAKEIRAAQQVGYQIAAVRCFDMFPNTHHFETVVHLKRT